MATITISKKEYRELIEKKLRYEYLHQIMEEDIFSSPPTKNIQEVVRGFKATKKYNRRFVNSLEKGLKRSACFKI
ncbi:hypothetical protein A3I18_01310 [Candidatus Campbellbacteria bacterium RIFCSPLOWO2_02_FULL_35_11]|uniref:Uncharacterized protein n=1 Tax=Candidatus Campbellbacteria bacterium RIFCSPLOWO2_02_FULL_35_11 TaxID=1797581 RepID=A0A1F5ETY5_9BACT|nr:MAG: hypothetical protein A3I18_01310 [Candidatus Campbellbacteria bacterium RIFCSPLOWO2_02_FULL_35_11]